MIHKNKNITNILRSLPDNPGVYQFFDKDEKIIYIGKATSLKKRVASYFQKESQFTGKLKVLVSKIVDIKHIVVNSEFDARLLENNLIKKYQPRYNVMLKDDRTFPWICIKKEPFPRIFSTRNIIHDGSDYFGPYASVRMMNTLLSLIRQLYPLRNCKHNLTPSNIEKGKFRVCLQYHIGKCLGPCIGEQKEEDYNQSISEIRNIIKGNISSVISVLKSRMMDYAKNLEFEKAQLIKEKLEHLENYQSKSTVVNPKIHNVDIYSIVSDEKSGYVNFLRVINGAVVQSHTLELKKKLDESNKELLGLAITDLKQRFHGEPEEILINIKPDIELSDVKVTIPKIGDKKQLLELSIRNANYYRMEKMKQLELVDPERHSKRILAQMKKDLKLKEDPVHIECFDNSNTQGKDAVAAMVCFKNAKPYKKEYRHYNIKSVEGPDDYASMVEIVYRRYKRLLDEKKDLPQLIVIDGGKGQLNAAMQSIEKLGLRGKITVIGIAKKLEEIYYFGDSIPMYIDKTSETLKVIQHLRDEAHRFGITHHRKKRQKTTLSTELESIKGIGPEVARKLLTFYKSVKNVKAASLDSLEGVVGKAKSRIVYEHFYGK